MGFWELKAVKVCILPYPKQYTHQLFPTFFHQTFSTIMDTHHQQPNAPVTATAFKYGLLVTLIGIVLSLIFFFTGNEMSQWAQWLTYLVLFTGIVLAAKDYRDNLNGGNLTVGKTIALGTLIAFIAGLLGVVYFFFYTNVLNPDFMEQVLLQTEQQMIDQGLDDDQIEQAMAMTKKFTNPMMMSIFTVVFYTIFGLIFSVIAGFVMKKEN